MKKFLLTAGVAGLAVVAIAWGVARVYMSAPIAALAEPVVFEVSEGSSLNRVAAELDAAGIISWPRVFTAWGRLTGKAHRIQAGEYLLAVEAAPAGILDQLVNGRVRLHPFTILEGWTLREIIGALADNAAISMTVDPADPDMSVFSFPGMMGDTSPEGWFFPETYFVPRNTTDIEVLGQAYELMERRLTSAWDSRAVGLPLQSPYELLALASIIERETAVDGERPQVAGVFIRRLNKGMRLQTDPTVIYGLGEEFDGNLTRRHLMTDNPYNTYKRSGLPPTPIGAAGEASLQAAGHPDDSDALYFVASGEGDGTHVFSATLEEHNAAVAAYISALRKANRERRAAGDGQ